MKGNQHFKYQANTKHLIHKPTGNCVDSDGKEKVFVNPCSANSTTQRWEWTHVDEKVLDDWEKNGPKAKGGLR